MTVFRLFLVLVFVVIAAYTAVTIANHGWNLLPVFFGNMKDMAWPGQFNLDFLFMLMFSGLWVAWRHHFSAIGIVLGLLATFGGALFLSVYLLFQTTKTKGDTKTLLLGPIRASA